ncbi:MAG: GIY-YIG nuclease family protein [Saprospiraceae bacterium]|nr:GIY-YIG nuclease family protein [Saprospiraceae bacterium]
MKYYVYILYAEAHDKYYIGQTQDVAARLKGIMMVSRHILKNLLHGS